LTSAKASVNARCHILKQKLCLARIDVFSIFYKYVGKAYSLYIFGTDKKVFAPISPISEIQQNYLDSATKLFKAKDYFPALEDAEKAIKINPKDEVASKLKKQIIKKITRPSLIGGVIGGGLAGIIMAGFYNDSEFFMGACVIGLVIGYLFKWKFSLKIKNKKKRFIYPSVAAFIISFILFALASNPPADQQTTSKQTPSLPPASNHQPVSVPAIPNQGHEDIKQVIAAADVNNFVNRWLSSQSSNNVNELVEFYADKVDFYKSGLVTKAFIETDKKNYFKRWPQREYQPIEPIETLPAPNSNQIIVKMKYHFSVTNSAKKKEGDAYSELILTKDNNDKIVIIKEDGNVIKKLD